MVSINEVKGAGITPVLHNLINRVDNIVQPTFDELKTLLSKSGKVLAIKSGGVVIAHFFTNQTTDTLVLECMLGKAVAGIDPCVILNEYAEQEAKRLNLSKIRINTKRAGVVRKFLDLGFDSVEFVIEKTIQ